MARKKNSESFISRYSGFGKKDLLDIKVKILQDDLLNFITIHAVDYNLLVSEYKISIVFDNDTVFEMELLIFKLRPCIFYGPFIIYFCQLIWRLMRSIYEYANICP